MHTVRNENICSEWEWENRKDGNLARKQNRRNLMRHAKSMGRELGEAWHMAEPITRYAWDSVYHTTPHACVDNATPLGRCDLQPCHQYGNELQGSPWILKPPCPWTSRKVKGGGEWGDVRRKRRLAAEEYILAGGERRKDFLVFDFTGIS